MPTPFDAFKTKLGVGQSSAPQLLSSNQNQQGQNFLDRLSSRKTTGENFYANLKQQSTNRVAQDLVKKSAGLKFDEWGKPDINLADFGTTGQSLLKGISQRGNLATQAAESKRAFQDAVTMQNIGSYGLTGTMSVVPSTTSGTSIPGATSDNIGAKAAAAAMKVAQNHTAYVWGGNSLTNGVDCSGLVQQIYRQLGVSVPRTTWEQAKNGKQVPVSDIRPGDLVFYNDLGHVGIYVGNGHIVHAANSKVGVITSNLNNSNGAPILVLRPY